MVVDTPYKSNLDMVERLHSVWGPLQRGASRNLAKLGQESSCPGCFHQRLDMADRCIWYANRGIRVYPVSDYNPKCLFDVISLNDGIDSIDLRTNALKPLAVAFAEVWGDLETQKVAIEWLMLEVLNSVLRHAGITEVQLEAAQDSSRDAAVALVSSHLKGFTNLEEDLVDFCSYWLMQKWTSFVYRIPYFLGLEYLGRPEIKTSWVIERYLDAIARAKRGERAFPDRA